MTLKSCFADACCRRRCNGFSHGLPALSGGVGRRRDEPDRALRGACIQQFNNACAINPSVFHGERSKPAECFVGTFRPACQKHFWGAVWRMASAVSCRPLTSIPALLMRKGIENHCIAIRQMGFRFAAEEEGFMKPGFFLESKTAATWRAGCLIKRASRRDLEKPLSERSWRFPEETSRAAAVACHWETPMRQPGGTDRRSRRPPEVRSDCEFSAGAEGFIVCICRVRGFPSLPEAARLETRL